MRDSSFPMPTIKYATGPFCHLDSPIVVESGKMTNSQPSPQHYCLRWNNHITNFVQMIAQLLKSETFADCTIAVDDGTTIKCHKMVLAACSSYFNELFTKNPCEHPMVILSDVKYHEIRAILDYMYRGEVNVLEDELSSLLKIANFLKVKGLIDEDRNNRVQPELDREEPPLSMLTAAAAAAQAAAVAAAAAAANGNGSPLTNGYNSPPPHVAAPFSMPFGKSPLDGHNPMSLWPLTSLHQMPQHPISGHQPPPRSSFLAGSYDAISDSSPLSRKKRSSYMANRDTPILRNVLGGQNDSPMSDRQETYSNNSNGSIQDSDRRNSSEHSEPMVEDDEKPTTPHKYGSHKEQKPEWKRYKQYTRQDIAGAMAAVKNKEMSALQAASKYGIPSRTLYDKLKKAGILPTRGAGIQRASRSDPAASSAVALCAGSARFPYSSSMNGSVYGAVGGGNGVSESESETNGYDVPTSLVVTPTNGHASRNEDMDVQTASNNGQQSGNEDGAEDLSVGSRRSSDHSVIVPLVVKEEGDEASMQHDNES